MQNEMEIPNLNRNWIL